MKGNVIQMNTLHLNSVRLNGIGKVQSVSLKGGSTEDPVFPPVEPPVEPTPTYTLSASVTNGKVSALRNGSAVNLPYTANEGDTIVLEVTPNDGYTFEGWNDGNTDNPRSITMTADVVLSAQCVEVVVPPAGKYIQFEDKAVEAICVANWSSDGIGLTEEDAAAVTSLNAVFNGNSAITSFDELRYFTGLTTMSSDIPAPHVGEFYNCTNLQRVTIPANVSKVLNYTFYKCTSLQSVTFEDASRITELGQRAFSNTAIGGDIAFPNLEKAASPFHSTGIERVLDLGKITSIDGISSGYASSFLDNSASLRMLYLPASLTALNGFAIGKCSALATIVSLATTPPTLSSAAFNGCSAITAIYVPDASVEAYKTAVNWSAYADRIHPLSEIEGDNSRLDYIHDSMLMWLDGKDKGTIEGEWQDLVSGNTFVNDGAIALADGWEFDGTSASMQSQSLGDYVWVEKSRTLEVVLTFYREGVNEIAFAGMSGCMAFGLYQNEYILSMSPWTLPSVNAEVSRGLIFGASYSKGIFVRALANGEPRQIASEQQYWGNAVDNYSFLGRRSNGIYFKGKIHAIRIHDRILTEEEILHNQRIDNKRFNLGLDI